MTGDEGDALRLVLAPNPSAMTQHGTNTWIVGTGSVAVIDPGPDDPRHLAAILAALAPGERIGHIFVTHAHADHSALAPALHQVTGAPVLAFGTAACGIRPWMAALHLDAGGSEGVDRAFRPDVVLADGARVDGPGWTIEALHTPGHLGNHMCFAWGARLFTGDHVMGWSSSIVAPPEGDMGAYMSSLRRLADRPWDVFLPGHGDPVPDPAARIAELRRHRLGREAEILQAVDDGQTTVAAITAAVYSRTPDVLRPAAARNVFAHLLDLHERNIVSAEPKPGMDALYRRV